MIIKHDTKLGKMINFLSQHNYFYCIYTDHVEVSVDITLHGKSAGFEIYAAYNMKELRYILGY